MPQFRPSDIVVFYGRTQRDQQALQLDSDLVFERTSAGRLPRIGVSYMLQPHMSTDAAWQDRVADDFAANVLQGANNTPTGPTNAQFYPPLAPQPPIPWPPVQQQPQLTQQAAQPPHQAPLPDQNLTLYQVPPQHQQAPPQAAIAPPRPHLERAATPLQTHPTHLAAPPFKTPEQTAIDASALVKGDGATVFAWGFGNKVSLAATLQQIATDSSKAILVQTVAELTGYLGKIKAAVCNKSPPFMPGPQWSEF